MESTIPCVVRLDLSTQQRSYPRKPSAAWMTLAPLDRSNNRSGRDQEPEQFQETGPAVRRDAKYSFDKVHLQLLLVGFRDTPTWRWTLSKEAGMGSTIGKLIRAVTIQNRRRTFFLTRISCAVTPLCDHRPRPRPRPRGSTGSPAGQDAHDCACKYLCRNRRNPLFSKNPQSCTPTPR